MGMVYSSDMVEFHDMLEFVNKHFEHLASVKITTELDDKHIQLLEDYLNLYCEPAKCRFKILKSLSKDPAPRKMIEFQMESLDTDRILKWKI